MVCDGPHRRVVDAHRPDELLEQLQLALQLVDGQPLVADLALHLADLLLLALDEGAQLAGTVVVLQLVLGYHETAALLARQRALRVVLALVEVRGQAVQLEHRRAPVRSVVAADAQAGQQVAQNPGHGSQVGRRDGIAVDGTGGLAGQPLGYAIAAEGMLTHTCLEGRGGNEEEDREREGI